MSDHQTTSKSSGTYITPDVRALIDENERLESNLDEAKEDIKRLREMLDECRTYIGGITPSVISTTEYPYNWRLANRITATLLLVKESKDVRD